MVILQCWKWGVASVGSVRCSHHEVQVTAILEPSLLQRQPGAWQTIQNVVETNIDARKYKWIAIIKFNLLARFRCCMWTSLLRKENLVTFNLQTLKLSSILQALIKLIKITESYESFLSFICCELNEKVLE